MILFLSFSLIFNFQKCDTCTWLRIQRAWITLAPALSAVVSFHGRVSRHPVNHWVLDKPPCTHYVVLSYILTVIRTNFLLVIRVVNNWHEVACKHEEQKMISSSHNFEITISNPLNLVVKINFTGESFISNKMSHFKYGALGVLNSLNHHANQNKGHIYHPPNFPHALYHFARAVVKSTSNWVA